MKVLPSEPEIKQYYPILKGHSSLWPFSFYHAAIHSYDALFDLSELFTK